MSSGDWNVRLFDCFGAPITCLWAWCVPCGGACLQCQTTKLMLPDSSAPLAFLLSACCCCFGVGYNRKNVREALSVGGSYLQDCFCAWCCYCCTMVQEWRSVMLNKGMNEDTLCWNATKQ